MPIPFLFIGIGAAALGVGKSIKAGIDQKDANDTNERARNIIKEATDEANISRKNSGDAITNLGKVKISILEESIKPFIASFEKLHNVELTDSVGLNELQKFRIDKQSFGELKEMQTMAASIAGGVASGAALGAITAFGAYGGAMAFGAASTGTAIASLSGIAATNATLAFLGGGSLAAGGLGIAGGTAVLGGLVAGPALAVMGFIVGAKASANKEKAYSNLEQAKEFREEMKTVKSVCKGIRMRANMFERLLLKLNALFMPLTYSLDQIIIKSGTDYSMFTPEEKSTVAACFSLAGVIKAVLDTPILSEDGSLTPESMEVADSVQGVLSATNNG
jgi:hypothetical protein